jgi:hypothetical protein
MTNEQQQAVLDWAPPVDLDGRLGLPTRHLGITRHDLSTLALRVLEEEAVRKHNSDEVELGLLLGFRLGFGPSAIDPCRAFWTQNGTTHTKM